MLLIFRLRETMIYPLIFSFALLVDSALADETKEKPIPKRIQQAQLAQEQRQPAQTQPPSGAPGAREPGMAEPGIQEPGMGEPGMGPSAAAPPAIPEVPGFGGLIPPASPSSEGPRPTPSDAVSVNPSQAAPRGALDVGDLLGKSPEAIGVDLQHRSSVISDPRVRGYHVGQVATWADGGFFFPARQDLDTAASKYDASIIRDVLIFKGPYSVQHGPGFAFLDVATLDALPWEPRYQCGPEYHGRTIMGYQSNGQKLDALQSFWGGDNDWGFRVSYGIRTGNDYEAGNDYRVPSSYNSQPWNFAVGFKITENSKIEFKGLHLDMHGVEFAGLYFDINRLKTDAESIRYEVKDQEYFDRLVIDAWYNRTAGNGDTLQGAKQVFLQQFISDSFAFPSVPPPPEQPQQIRDRSNTDFLEQSRGYRGVMTWGDKGKTQFHVGTDLNYLSQKLNENIMYQSVNMMPVPLFFGSPTGTQQLNIPSSHMVDPGIFMEVFAPVGDRFSFKTGIRFDWAETNSGPRLVTGNIPLFFNVDRFGNPSTGFDPIIFSQQPNNPDLHNLYFLWSGFISMDYKIDDHWLVMGSFGYAERPPTLTELYANGPFIFLLQPGLNRLYGDPHLSPEKAKQLEFGIRGNYECFRMGVTGFYAFINNYITFDQNSKNNGEGAGPINQVVFTNTDFATLAGGEVYLELDLTSWLTPFANLTYVEGRDRTHIGNAFTSGLASTRRTLAQEPLGGIPALDSRLGFRVHEPRKQPRWSIEAAVRAVKDQDYVAASLGEQPTPGFAVFDVRGFWQVLEASRTTSLRNPAVLLTAGVENIGNRTYREHLDPLSGAPTDLMFRPGTNAYIGVQIEY